MRSADGEGSERLMSLHKAECVNMSITITDILCKISRLALGVKDLAGSGGLGSLAGPQGTGTRQKPCASSGVGDTWRLGVCSPGAYAPAERRTGA